MNKIILKENVLNSFKENNNESIINSFKKMFNGSEDTNIKNKEFELLKFIFEFENVVNIDYTKYRYYKRAIFHEALKMKKEYDAKRTSEDEFFETMFYKKVMCL